ncbi:MAG TPA: NAD(P)-dependent oxidoreductase [Candidatus Saccharimonadales bacterium]|nr:NAD(P)-dependent oxidoreductase [Candidatus Saccharimonadales bacterium]
MDDSKFLITGADGQLGRALQAKYPNARATDSQELDITDQQAVSDFDWGNISTIINAAAYTDVDGAETQEGRVAAWRVNGHGVVNLTAAAIKHDVTLVHISTEYVFDGRQNPHTEDEPFSPLSVYGASKAAGEIVASMAPKHYILRASWLVGDGKNFVRTMLGLGQNGTAPTVVADQIGRLTFSDELVKAIDHLLKQGSVYGVYNVSSDGQPASWADVAREIFKNAGFSLQVTDTTTEKYYANKPTSAKRPLSSVFDLTKIKSTGLKLQDWRDDLKVYISKELNR